jgi:hypothetical protein
MAYSSLLVESMSLCSVAVTVTVTVSVSR